MNTTESFQGSIGLDSFITPHKPNATSTMRTLPSFNSLQYSEFSQNNSLGYQTISKILTQRHTEDRGGFSQKFSSVPQQEDGLAFEKRESYLLDLQKWFLPFYFLSKKQAKQSKELQEKIDEQERKNTLKKSYLRHQRANIENLVQKIKKKKQKILKNQQKYYEEIRAQIDDARDRIQELQNQIHQIQTQQSPTKNQKKKKNRRKSVNIPQPVFYVVGGYQDSSKVSFMQGPHYHNSTKNKSDKPEELTYSNTNPLNYVEQIFKNSSTNSLIGKKQQIIQSSNSNPKIAPYKEAQGASPFSGGNIGDLLGQALMRKMNSTDNLSSQQKGLNLQKKASASSKNWQNGDEEKEIIEILEKSEKKGREQLIHAKEDERQKRLKMTSSNAQQQKIEESKVNIMIEESSDIGSRFSIEKKRKPYELNSIKQSVIRLDVSESDSHSKSKQNNSDRSFATKKILTEDYSPTFKFNPDLEKSQLQIKLKKVTEQDSELFTSSKVHKKQTELQKPPHVKRESGDIKINQIFLDQNNLKESQAGSIEKLRISTMKPKQTPQNEKKITDPDEDDDEELFSINLLAVSKISKEKELSERAFASIEDEDSPKKITSGILKKSQKKDLLRGTNVNNVHNKMSKIEEEEIGQDQKLEERKRKNSGKYSLVLNSHVKKDQDIRKSGASSPVNMVQ